MGYTNHVWQSYNGHDRTSLKANCPNCNSNQQTEIVDVVLDQYKPGGTVPVWFCSPCDKLYAARSSELETAIQNYAPTQVQTYDRHSAYGYSVETHINDEIRKAAALIDNSISSIRSELEDMKIKTADPLYGLKKRVSEFELV